MRAVLEQAGYDVIEADGGTAALEAWRATTGSIDLVLTDLVMPGGIGGRELASQLTALCPKLKIVFITGYSRGPDQQQLGANQMLLNKPIDADQLLDVVASALGRVESATTP